MAFFLLTSSSACLFKHVADVALSSTSGSDIQEQVISLALPIKQFNEI